MSMRRLAFSAALAAVLLAPALAAGQEAETNREAPFARRATVSREQMESLELHLEQAVAKVSVSHAGILLGRANASRGYRLPGYGVVFVLTPRALPGDEAVYVFRGHPPLGRAHPGPRREAVRGDEMDELEALERQVLILQHAAETRRRAAQEDNERIVHSLRVRFGPASERNDEATEGQPEPAEEVLPTDEPLVSPPPPPWTFWFETDDPREQRSPEQVVEDVRKAVIAVLESRGAGVVGLEDGEFVTVAVDFVPGALFAAHPHPTRTLIVRARHEDLAARARGEMGPEELRAKVEVIEY
jgi:hypothetical protein